MTDGDALFAAILAHPDEDTPRLAYADWLQEQGEQDRAEFVRVQIELARLAPNEMVPWNRHAVTLRAREKALMAAHGAAWLTPLRAPGGPLQHEGTHGQFRRGFVEVVWMPAGWFAERGDVLFASAPVRELRVTATTPGELVRLADSPPAERLAGLDLSDRRLGDGAVEVIAGGRFGSALRVLRLRGCGVTDRGAFLLARDGKDWPLWELDVSHNPLSREGVAALRRRYADAVHAVGLEATA